MMKRKKQQFGFTLVELMVALMVAAVVLSAVATLADAASSAKSATDTMGRRQSQLQQVSIRLGDLIRQSNRIVTHNDWGFTLWQDHNANGILERGEFVTVFRCYYYDSAAGTYKNGIGIRPFAPDEAIKAGPFGWNFGFQLYQDFNNNLIYDAGEPVSYDYTVMYFSEGDADTEIYKQCQDPTFGYYNLADGLPRTAAVRFKTNNNGQIQLHSVNAHLRLEAH
jgi:prepilin-type N-terminal cleavage/methylation domain-containing protein